ncbi:MAG: ribulose-phosphate 3-epimerase [Spirochaetota bacterium]
MRAVTPDPVAIGASVSCADLADLRGELERLEEAGIDYLHYDVIDGRFNDTFILGVPTLAAIRRHTDLPIEVHLAVYEPERYLDQFIDAGADYLAVHPEGTDRLYQVVERIAGAGKGPVLALRPESGADLVPAELLDRFCWILKLTVNPGYAGQSFQQRSLAHLAELRGLIASRGLRTPIAADGNINPRTVPRVVRAGARMLVGGSSGLFSREVSLAGARSRLVEAALEALPGGGG